MVDCDALRTQAAKCRRLADCIGDKLTEERLLAMANEYERQAQTTQAQPLPSAQESRSFQHR